MLILSHPFLYSKAAREPELQNTQNTPVIHQIKWLDLILLFSKCYLMNLTPDFHLREAYSVRIQRPMSGCIEEKKNESKPFSFKHQ